MKRQAWKFISIGSLIINLGLGGGAGYLWWTGMIDAPRLEKIISLIQGTEPAPVAPTVESQPAPVEESGSIVERKQVNDEVAWRNYMRRMAELDQRKTVVQLEMLRVEKSREAFLREKDLTEQQQRARKQLDQTQGFQKELELVAQMKPKQALDYLLAKSPEDAAHMILRMEDRATKRIIQAAKTTEETTKLNQVLDLMKEMSAATDTRVDGGKPPSKAPASAPESAKPI